jgi:protein-tyrosine phosphatase
LTSILVVCTGNVCRSPIAEVCLRSELSARFGDRGPNVHSAGTAGWDGSPAFARSAEAAAEHGIDVSRHVARTLSRDMVEEADLVLCMAAEHRSHVLASTGHVEARTFTLKGLVRVLEQLPLDAASDDPGSLGARIEEADSARATSGSIVDEDIEDPYGDSVTAHRAIVVEIEEWTRRLVTGLYGANSSDRERADG